MGASTSLPAQKDQLRGNLNGRLEQIEDRLLTPAQILARFAQQNLRLRIGKMESLRSVWAEKPLTSCSSMLLEKLAVMLASSMR